MSQINKGGATAGESSLDYRTLGLLWCVFYSVLLGSLVTSLACNGETVGINDTMRVSAVIKSIISIAINLGLAWGSSHRTEQFGFVAAAMFWVVGGWGSFGDYGTIAQIVFAVAVVACFSISSWRLLRRAETALPMDAT